MKFFLSGKIKFSGSLEKAKKDIEEAVENANKDLLVRGAPKGKEKEASRVSDFRIKGDQLFLEIHSGRYVRAHEGLNRIKKKLGEVLGKKHRVGARDVEILDYRVEFELEKEPVEKFTIPFAKETKFSKNKCTLTLENLDAEFLKRNYIDRMIKLVEEKVEAQHFAGKSEHWELIWKSKEKKHAWNEDPSKVIERKSWVKRAGGIGQWIYGPIIAKIMRTFDRIVEKELLEPLGFSEMIFPKVVDWGVWKRSGHAKSIYPEIYYVCPPQTRDPKFWEEISDLYKITGEVPVEKLKDKIKDPIGGVTYAQCPPFWPYLSGKTIADSEFPVKVFDRSGTSMRYESGGLQGIERVNEFHRIEVVWLGFPEQVREMRDRIVERYKHIFNDILELEWRMAWVTPWFMSQEGMIGLAEEKKERNIGTIDFEAYLPYRGSREESEWLEFQNASNNGPKYPSGFNVKAQNQKELWSGCTGIGLERWVVTFLAQKGLEEENWPGKFRKYLGKLPEPISFL